MASTFAAQFTSMIRCSYVFLLAVALLTQPVMAQYASPLSEDSISAMLSQWHALPEAAIETVGLGAGARGMDEVPGALHVISPAELERYAYTDPLRVLRAVSGVNVQEEDGYGLRPNIGLRGSGSERSARITLMEDGVLIAPAPYTAPAAYYFPSIARMASVEVLKGSSQIAFGPQTAGGAINLVTAALDGEGASVLYRAEGSGFGGRLQHIRLIQHWKGNRGQWGVLVEGMQFGSDGFKALPSNAPTGFAKTDGLVKLKWSTPAGRGLQQSVQLKVGFVDELSHETYAGLAAVDFQADPYQRYTASERDAMEAEQSQAVLRHVATVSDRWTMETDLYSTRFHRNWYKLDGYENASGVRQSLLSLYQSNATVVLHEETPEGAALLLKANNRWYGSQGLQHRGTWKFGSLEAANQLVYGIRVHEDWVDRFQWQDAYRIENGRLGLLNEGVRGSAGNRIDGARAFAGFVRATLRKGRWTLTPGLRTEQMEFRRSEFGADVDRNEPAEKRFNAVGVWLPGMGLTFERHNQDHLFLGVHRGFIPPGSAPSTLPETSLNAELGYRWSRAQSGGQLVVFHTTYDRLLGSDLSASGGSGSGDMFNGGTAQTSGIEFEWAGELAPRAKGFALPLRLTYTYTLARFTSAFESDFGPWSAVEQGDYFPYLSPHQGNAQLSWVRGSYTVECNARYASGMRVVAGQAALSQSESTDAVALLDVLFRKEFDKGLNAYVGVNNAFNHVAVVAMRPAGLRPNMPRTLRMGMSIAL
jgi:Fe(3+) dicitrate transport protein